MRRKEHGTAFGDTETVGHGRIGKNPACFLEQCLGRWRRSDAYGGDAGQVETREALRLPRHHRDHGGNAGEQADPVSRRRLDVAGCRELRQQHHRAAAGQRDLAP
jgi:hypothetical protein